MKPMGRVARYLTHPNVLIDPDKKIDRWSLNKTGKARVAALVASGALSGTRRVITSAETKALETATPLAAALGCECDIRPAMGENDRSSTGYLPPEKFEEAADAFFASPNVSFDGWEKASFAQDRIVSEVEACLSAESSGDVLFVGHGAVGTLLYCHLAGLEISRRHDQGPGGGGSFFEFNLDDRTPKSGWQPMENLINRP